jgi:hypothetical protein
MYIELTVCTDGLFYREDTSEDIFVHQVRFGCIRVLHFTHIAIV